jgi:hypothetical protein
MKLSELTIGTEYAIVPSWTYNSRSARDVDSVRENDVVRAELISMDKYEYEPSNRKDNAGSFTKAQAGNRSVGVLVKALDSNGKEIFWTSRLADIIAPYAVLEPKWKALNSAQEAKEREQQETRRKLEIHRAKVQAEVERSTGSIIQTSKELLGVGTYVSVDTEGYDLDYKGVVKLSLAEFESLIEMAYAGKDNA